MATAKPFLAWSSQSLSQAPLDLLPAGVNTLVQDGPVLRGRGHQWLRLPRWASTSYPRDSALQAWYWHRAWAKDRRWEAVGLDEFVVGLDSVDSWVRQLDALKWYCRQSGAPEPPVVLAWSTVTGDRARIVADLQALQPYVWQYALQPYLSQALFDRQFLHAKNLMDSSHAAGLWGKSLMLFNWSDRPEWFEHGSHYAVFGPDGSGLRRVVSGYEHLWGYAGGLGLPAGYGLWSANYLSQRATEAHEDFLQRVGWYGYHSS